MSKNTPCHICSGSLRVSSLSKPLKQVTSDCRPWDTLLQLAICESCGAVQKPIDKEWLVDMDRLYSGYHIYAQANGEEQKVSFSEGGVGVARSESLVNFLFSGGWIEASGKLLDVGCGNGAFLRAFRKANDFWQLTGLELDDRYRSVVEAIPETRLITSQIESLDEKFDAVVLIHALEHITDPTHFLGEVHRILSPGGIVLIEVPNFEKSPFDILIADHCTHFTTDVLKAIVEYAGFEVVSLGVDYIAKEISLIARKQHIVNRESFEIQLKDIDKNHLLIYEYTQLLESIIDTATSVRGKFGIFGSSISATWLASEFPEKAMFFVDEDPNRIGKNHMGLPILSPYDCPLEVPVLFPLRHDISLKIKERLPSNHKWITI